MHKPKVRMGRSGLSIKEATRLGAFFLFFFFSWREGNEPSSNEGVEERRGHGGAGISEDVNKGNGQEDGDVLEVIEMGAAHSLNIVVHGDGSFGPLGVLRVGKGVCSESFDSMREERRS